MCLCVCVPSQCKTLSHLYCNFNSFWELNNVDDDGVGDADGCIIHLAAAGRRYFALFLQFVDNENKFTLIMALWDVNQASRPTGTLDDWQSVMTHICTWMKWTLRNELNPWHYAVDCYIQMGITRKKRETFWGLSI